MYTLNTIYSIKEYMEQGFTKLEAFQVRRTDIMHNNWDNLTDDQKDFYSQMVKKLGL